MALITKSNPRNKKGISPVPSIDDQDEDDEGRELDRSRSYVYLELFEYYAFLAGGAALWIGAAWSVLKWQKFPISLYIVEVGFIFILPIILLAIILHFMDRIVKRNRLKTR